MRYKIKADRKETYNYVIQFLREDDTPIYLTMSDRFTVVVGDMTQKTMAFIECLGVEITEDYQYQAE